MHRRSILPLALAALAVPGTARADRGDTLQPGDSRAVGLIRTDGRGAVVQSIALGDGIGLRWRGGAAVWNEDRCDLSRLSPMFRMPFARRWEDARTLGQIALAGDTLTADLPEARHLVGRRVTIGLGGVSWDLPGVLGATGGRARGGEILGEARMGGDGVVLIQLAAWPAL